MMDRRRRRCRSGSCFPAMPAAAIVVVLLLGGVAATEGGAGAGDGERLWRLWVFGDSYADTGNLGDLGRELTHAWYDPYGRTFPRRPSGRFSDGRVLTDFLASAMGMATPVAYKLRRRAPRALLARGMNFAVGGAGVLDTGNFQRNLSAQIDLFFQAQHRQRGNRDGADGAVEVALVVVSGNDYSYAADKDNGTLSAAIAYIPTVVRRLGEQLRRLRDEAGMGKVVVTSLHPMGCTPLFTRPLNYTGCDQLANAGAAQHNAALRSVLAALDPDPGNSTFLLLDVHAAFAAAAGGFTEPLRPCCESFSPDGYCGEEDDGGARRYALCDAGDPGRHFYWDDVHPTQAAWAAAAAAFIPTLRRFLSLSL